MNKGEIESAIRRALNIFDEWVDVTGVVQKHTSYYYEMQSIIEDAVHCGAQGAPGIHKPLESEIHYKKKCEKQKKSVVGTLVSTTTKRSSYIHNVKWF